MHRYPDDPDYWCHLAEVQVASGGDSVTTLRKAIEKYPKAPMLWFLLGSACEKLEDAIATFETAIDRFPDYHSWWWGRLAVLNKRKGGIGEEVKVLDMALCSDPRNGYIRDTSDIWHYASCESCRLGIKGHRYRCESCDDYDLCETCFKKKPQSHAHHEFRTIPSDEWVSKHIQTEE
jgi:tetratricopeptide (TPR) repeat protein